MIKASAAPYQSQTKNSDPAVGQRAGDAGRGRNREEAGEARQRLLFIIADGYPGTDYVQPCNQSDGRHRLLPRRC